MSTEQLLVDGNLFNTYLQNFFIPGQDLGAFLSIYYKGKQVVDLWDGWFDESKAKPYGSDTLQIPFSTTKGLVAAVVALCVQRGATAISELAIFNDNRYHQAEIPGVNGITNARSVARLYASLIDDLDNGKQKRLLNEEIMKKATTSNTPDNEIDRIRGYSNSFAMGFQTSDDDLKIFASGTFGHEGAGGSIVFAAPDKSLAFAYTVNQYGVKKNRQEISPRTQAIIKHIA
ncbi:unnamed protein product [Rotaria socialis]|uniref:Beta-lactamase-related domain-containing protein n=1 Tax=Rotaria socialis TaxID=392032 RepID=A0A817WQV3_9BILA|nr:unnamed protein product [Rotaria socialis]CAF4466351.1 unnamed protein product [Rotaria socialis]